MALVKCPECNKDVSDEAKACPHCSHSLHPAPAKKAANATRSGCLGIIGLFGLLILIGVLSDSRMPKERTCVAGLYHGVIVKDPYALAELHHFAGRPDDSNTIVCTKWGYENPDGSSAGAPPQPDTASKTFPDRESYCRNWVANFNGATEATNDQLYAECIARDDLTGEPTR